jgi:hypothetical protein
MSHISIIEGRHASCSMYISPNFTPHKSKLGEKMVI